MWLKGGKPDSKLPCNRDIYFHKPRPQSKIVNSLDSEISGNLKMTADKLVSGNWVLEREVHSSVINVPANGLVKLDIGEDSNGNKVSASFNNLYVRFSQAGDYRVKVRFESLDSINNLVKILWEFSVK